MFNLVFAIFLTSLKCINNTFNNLGISLKYQVSFSPHILSELLLENVKGFLDKRSEIDKEFNFLFLCIYSCHLSRFHDNYNQAMVIYFIVKREQKIFRIEMCHTIFKVIFFDGKNT